MLKEKKKENTCGSISTNHFNWQNVRKKNTEFLRNSSSTVHHLLKAVIRQINVKTQLWQRAPSCVSLHFQHLVKRKNTTTKSICRLGRMIIGCINNTRKIFSLQVYYSYDPQFPNPDKQTPWIIEATLIVQKLPILRLGKIANLSLDEFCNKLQLLTMSDAS